MNATNVKAVLKHAYNANDSVLIDGKHGIGKTSVVRQFAKENNLYVETLILSLKDPADLLGMPNTDKSMETSRTIWAEPDWFQKIVDKAWPKSFFLSDLEFSDKDFEKFCSTQFEEDSEISRSSLNQVYCRYYKLDSHELQLTKEQYNVSCKKSQNSVLFLDELNRAYLDTRQCALQLVLEKELHSHKLPYVNGRRTFIAAAINPSDLYQTEELDAALLDRFIVIEMTLDVYDWLKYSEYVHLKPVILDFISESPEYLHYMPENNAKGSTPRSWEKFSSYLDDEIESNAVLEGIMIGKLGKEVGSAFYVYYKNYSTILKIEDIIEKCYNLKTKNVEVISKEIKKITADIETIRKHSLSNQLIQLAKEELNSAKYNIMTLTLLGFLSSLNFEISIMICKKLKSEDKDLYDKLVLADEKLNSKAFFAELIKYSR